MTQEDGFIFANWFLPNLWQVIFLPFFPLVEVKCRIRQSFIWVWKSKIAKFPWLPDISYLSNLFLRKWDASLHFSWSASYEVLVCNSIKSTRKHFNSREILLCHLSVFQSRQLRASIVQGVSTIYGLNFPRKQSSSWRYLLILRHSMSNWPILMRNRGLLEVKYWLYPYNIIQDCLSRESFSWAWIMVGSFWLAIWDNFNATIHRSLKIGCWYTCIQIQMYAWVEFLLMHNAWWYNSCSPSYKIAGWEGAVSQPLQFAEDLTMNLALTSVQLTWGRH